MDNSEWDETQSAYQQYAVSFSSYANQRLRLLERLKQGPLTTNDARYYLEIMHPAGRIKELRALGYIIHTNIVRFCDGERRARMAEYVLEGDQHHE